MKTKNDRIKYWSDSIRRDCSLISFNVKNIKDPNVFNAILLIAHNLEGDIKQLRASMEESES